MRERKPVKYESASSGEEDEEDWMAYYNKQKGSSRSTGKVGLVAKVASLAINLEEGAVAANAQDEAKGRLAKANQEALARIQKAIALGTHANSTEGEQRNAMRMAQKLMTQHSISQADLIAAESASERVKRAGQSVVTVEHDGGLQANMAGWLGNLMDAMMIFFPCKCYTMAGYEKSRYQVVFYGLAEETAAAATAFEACFNQIMIWKEQQPGITSVNAKNSYCTGVAYGLRKLAKAEVKAEAQRVIKAEKEQAVRVKKEEEDQRLGELERLKRSEVGGSSSSTRVKVEDMKEEEDIKPTIERVKEEKGKGKGVLLEDLFNDDVADEAEDDEEWGGGGFEPYEYAPDFVEGDHDVELDDSGDAFKLVSKPMANEEDVKPDVKPEIKPKVKKEEEEATWRSTAQLVKFKADAEAVADDYLKNEAKIKVYASKRSAGLTFKDPKARNAYNKGIEDSRSMDVKRRRLTGKDY